jgi:hypothetical protein
VPSPPILREPLEVPSTWKGADLQRHPEDWIRPLSSEQVDDLEAAFERALASGKPLAEIRREDFPLPVLGPAIAEWMQALQKGRGFINVRGVPVAGRSDAEIGLLHWGLGLHMGTPVSQNAAGDLLGHVRDTGDDPRDPSVRLYKTRVDLGFHSDGSDLVALLCIRQGRSGGENRLVSTTAIYNELLRRCPERVPLLYEPWYWDRNEEQAEGEPPFFQLPICRYHEAANEKRLTFFYIPWYIRGCQRHAEVPRLSDEQNALLDEIDRIAEDPAFHVVMRLEPGEVNYLKNNAVLHSRTEFADWEEPERKRHLVRLWLTAHGDWADGDAFVQQGIPRKPGVRSDADAVSA